MRVRSIVMFVGAAGFEPAKECHLSGFQSQCVCQFRHAPIVRRVAYCGAGSVSPRPQPDSKAARIASRIHFTASGIVVKAVASSCPSPRSQGRSALDTPAPRSHYGEVAAYLFLGWRGCGDLTPRVRVGHNLDVRERLTLPTRGYAPCLCFGSGLKRSESIGSGSC
jgi:hypothetical protein